MRIIAPEDDAERGTALAQAALKPALFAEIKEKWPDRPPSDESLRSFLVRKGFSQGALDQVIQFYRETIDMVGSGGQAQGPASVNHKEAPVQPSPSVQPSVIAPPSPAALLGNKPFTVAFDGSVLTGAIAIRKISDIDRLMKVLSAQKAAFEAMVEDEPPENEPTADPTEPV